MSSAQLHYRMTVFIALGAIGACTMTSPLLSIVGSGKTELLGNPAVVFMMVIGLLLLTASIVLAGLLSIMIARVIESANSSDNKSNN